MSIVQQQVNRRFPWRLVSQDPEIALRLEGQYQPEGGVLEVRPPVLGANVAVGSDAPSVQWVAAGAHSVTLRSRYRSLNNRDDLRPRKATLQRLTARDPQLGRAPRVLFEWGDVRLVGFVSSLRVTEVGRWITGLPIEVAFDLEVTAAPVVDVATEDPGAGETLYVALRAGETFETLGQRYLGDPLRGELVRRINPELAAGEAAGDRVKVFERDHPAMRGRVRPLSPALLTARDGSRPWVDVVNDLATGRGYTDRGLPWRLLPEVLAGEV